MNWNLPHWVPLTIFFSKFFSDYFFFQEQKKFFQGTTFIQFFMYCKAKKNSEWSEIFWKFLIFKNHKVNWDPPWRISIHRDFDSLGVPFHPVVVIGLGKNLLFKSVLEHCDCLLLKRQLLCLTKSFRQQRMRPPILDFRFLDRISDILYLKAGNIS